MLTIKYPRAKNALGLAVSLVLLSLNSILAVPASASSQSSRSGKGVEKLDITYNIIRESCAVKVKTNNASNVIDLGVHTIDRGSFTKQVVPITFSLSECGEQELDYVTIKYLNTTVGKINTADKQLKVAMQGNDLTLYFWTNPSATDIFDRNEGIVVAGPKKSVTSATSNGGENLSAYEITPLYVNLYQGKNVQVGSASATVSFEIIRD